MEELKKTSLYDLHVSLGAKMVPFAGYLMPVRYSSDVEEHMAVRNAAGLFDVSHMGEFIISGEKAGDFIDRITTNRVSSLKPGKAQYTCFTNEKGGILDDLIVYCLKEDEYMLVVNASNIDKDAEWVEYHLPEGVNFHNASEEMSLLALQGPEATGTLQECTDVQLDEIPFYNFTRGTVCGVQEVIISATGYTGAGGFELYVPQDKARTVWEGLMNAGEGKGLLPAGLGARDTLRLEMGYCLYGNDISESTTPLEAGLGWVTKTDTSFIGADVLKEQKEKGVERKLTGFKMEEKGIPRSGYPIIDESGKNVGVVTSGTMSPVLKKGIGLGYIDKGAAKKGSTIYIQIRKKSIKAVVTRPPFI